MSLLDMDYTSAPAPVPVPVPATTRATATASPTVVAPTVEELATAAYTLFDAGCTSLAYQCIVQVNLLHLMKELSHQKVVAMELDDLEGAILVRNQINDMVKNKLRDAEVEAYWVEESRRTMVATATSPSEQVRADIAAIAEHEHAQEKAQARSPSRRRVVDAQGARRMHEWLSAELDALENSVDIYTLRSEPKRLEVYLRALCVLAHRSRLALLVRTDPAFSGLPAVWNHLVIEIKLLLEVGVRKINELEKLCSSSVSSKATQAQDGSAEYAVIKTSHEMSVFTTGIQKVIEVFCLIAASYSDAMCTGDGAAGEGSVEGSEGVALLIPDVLALCKAWSTGAARVGLYCPPCSLAPAAGGVLAFDVSKCDVRDVHCYCCCLLWSCSMCVWCLCIVCRTNRVSADLGCDSICAGWTA